MKKNLMPVIFQLNLISTQTNHLASSSVAYYFINQLIIELCSDSFVLPVKHLKISFDFFGERNHCSGNLVSLLLNLLGGYC